jgi:hypothetical protein
MSNLRELARGRQCQVRIPGVCNHDPATTVLAHLPGGGMGRKQPDLLAAWACSACHDAIDGRGKAIWDRDWLRTCHLDGVIRTQQILIEEGVIRW